MKPGEAYRLQEPFCECEACPVLAMSDRVMYCPHEVLCRVAVFPCSVTIDSVLAAAAD